MYVCSLCQISKSVPVDKCRSVCNSTVWRCGARRCVCWAWKWSLCQQQHDVNNSMMSTTACWHCTIQEHWDLTNMWVWKPHQAGPCFTAYQVMANVCVIGQYSTMDGLSLYPCNSHLFPYHNNWQTPCYCVIACNNCTLTAITVVSEHVCSGFSTNIVIYPSGVAVVTTCICLAASAGMGHHHLAGITLLYSKRNGFQHCS